MNEPTLTLVGNLTGDPELRFTQSGAPVAGFTVANTPSIRNKDTGQWEDGQTLFMRCTVWKQLAENVAESLVKGQRVIVTGRLEVRAYEKDGQARTSQELVCTAVGPDLTFKPIGQAAQPTQPQAPAGDPWATQTTNGAPF